MTVSASVQQRLNKAEAPQRLIPAERYTGTAYLAAERDRLWPRVWQIACREEEVAAPGDYLEYQIGRHSILIVRSDQGQVKAFHNVCLHRGTRLKRGCGSAQELRCMFHAWSWALDGSNKHVTDCHDFPGLDRSALSLRECRIGRWGGFVFINLDPNAEPLESFLGPVVDLFQRFELDRLRIQSCRRTIMPCNWKVPIDNFNESYHVVGLHPQQLPFIDDTKILYETAGIHSREVCRNGIASARLEGTVDEDEVLAGMIDAVRSTYYQGNVAKREEMASLEALTVPSGKTARDVIVQIKRDRLTSLNVDHSQYSDGDLIDGHGLHLFPNTVMHLNYGEAFVVRTRPNGDDPNTCIAEIINLDFPAPDENRGRPTVDFIADPKTYDWGLVIEQDLQCFEEVQIGLHSRGFPGIRLAEYQELRIRHMHAMLDRYVGA